MLCYTCQSMVKIDHRQKGGNNMVIEIISWALKILIVILIASVLCLAWYVWDRTGIVSPFRTSGTADKFSDPVSDAIYRKRGCRVSG